jgi:hypothetical protein
MSRIFKIRKQPQLARKDEPGTVGCAAGDNAQANLLELWLSGKEKPTMADNMTVITQPPPRTSPGQPPG